MRFQFRQREVIGVIAGWALFHAGLTIGQEKTDPLIRPVRPAHLARQRLQADPNAKRHVPPQPLDLAAMRVSSEERKRSELNDVMLIGSHMYGLTEQETQRIAKSVSSEIELRWSRQRGGEKYASLIDRRVQIINKSAMDSNNQTSEQDLIKIASGDPQFGEINAQLQQLDALRPLDFTAFIPMIETSISPERVQAAHTNWQTNALSLPQQYIQNKPYVQQVTSGSYEDMMATGQPSMRRGPSPRVLAATRKTQNSTPATPMAVGQPAQNITPAKPQPVAPANKDSTKVVAPLSAKGGTGPATSGAVASGARPSNSNPQKPASAAAPRPTPPPARAPATPPRPLNDWERFVVEFIQKYQLTQTQQNAAMAILRDMSTRAAQVQKANESRLKDAEKITDARARADKIRDLNAPIDGMFERMKARLENLLTVAQRELGHPPAPVRK